MKVPYALVAAMDTETRHGFMATALATGLPKLSQTPIDDRQTLSVACYGPSLADTYRALTPPIISMSGATRYLADRGIVADYHLDMDPRAHKIRHLDPPVPGVQYLMATCCPPQTWDLLARERVRIWHAYQGKETPDWVRAHDPGALLVRTGSSVGLGALHIGGLLGFRHFEIHGMDGSLREARHAGPHYGPPQKKRCAWNAGGVPYQSTEIMANATAEMLNMVAHYPIFCVFHGHGLTQALVREAGLENACCADEAAKAERIRKSRCVLVDLPPFTPSTGSPWDAFMSDPDPAWVGELHATFRDNEARRAAARYNTGAIGLETGLLLRALCATYRPKVVVEVGTFIGNSTAALRATSHLYTCDRDNDCLPSTPTRTCHPYTTSAAMFERLLRDGVRADLVFLDGRLTAADVPLLLRLVHQRTVFAFDDYHPRGKGLWNVDLLRPFLQAHVLLEPYPAFQGRTTLAALIPLVPK